MLQIRSLCLAHSACAGSVTQCATSTRFKVTAGDAFVSPLKQELIPKMPPKGNRKARQGKDVAKKRNTHTHTHSNRKQKARRSSSSRVRRSFNFAAIPAQTHSLSPFLVLSLSLELRHSSSSTFTHTHTHTPPHRRREKRQKKKETEKRSILFRASRMSFSTFATCCLRLCFCSASAVSGACLATCHLFFGQMLLPLLAF